MKKSMGKSKRRCAALLTAFALLFTAVAVYLPSSAAAAEGDGSETTNLLDSLTGYYPFENSLGNEAGSGSASVHVGGTDGSWNSGDPGSATYGDGYVGQAYSFKGDVDNVRGDGLELDVKGTSEYTVSFWVNPSNYPSMYTSLVFSAKDASHFLTINSLNAFYCSVEIGTAWDWDNRGGDFVCLDGALNGVNGYGALNTWTYVTVTSESGAQKLYFNGVEYASAASTDSSVVDCIKDQYIYLGINWWDASFCGLMDEVTVYSAALTADEVLTLYDHAGDPIAAAEAQKSGQLSSAVSHVTVHDPSVVKGYVAENVTSLSKSTEIIGEKDEDHTKEIYFIFGSHLAWAYSWDMVNWTTFTNNINSGYETLFADEAAWSAKGSELKEEEYDLSGNMWAPDVIWNKSMQKWCMYMSINGEYWYSTICMLTADSLYGDWTHAGKVIASGNWNGTPTFDYEQVTGEAKPDSRYAEMSKGGDLLYEDNCIDPCVLYDEDGNLWMSYGSWFGGIWMIKLDPATGLRDYTTTYEYVVDVSDPYQGYKIAQGHGSSGEASYIQYIKGDDGDGYYYLFVTYGGLTAAGGYNMRVYRSESISGPYVDESGDYAVYSTYQDNVSSSLGMRLMSYYKWSFMDYAQVAQGHNSVLVDDDGSIYLVYHRRTNDGTEGHEVRVHQMFLNEDGWLVTAPFEYTASDSMEESYAKADIAGTYETLLMTSDIDYASLDYVHPSSISLNEDGTLSGAASGTWSISGSNITITTDEDTYKGVCLTQAIEGKQQTTMTFTAVGEKTELAFWGYCLTDEMAVELEPDQLTIPAQTVNATALSLPTSGFYQTDITWTSSNPDVIATDGTVTEPENNTDVTLTAVIQKGDYSNTVSYTVTVLGSSATAEDGTITVWHSDETYDLSKAGDGTYRFPNYFNSEIGTAGLPLYGGAEIDFTVNAKTAAPALSTIWGFTVDGATGGNLFYFCGGSYLGYNAAGGYFDANLDNYNTAVDYIGTNKDVNFKVVILPYTYEVYVDGTLAYSYDTVSAGTTKGTNLVDTVYSVLSYLSETATDYNLGWGSWWGDSFNGTIKDITFYALPGEEPEVVGYLYSEDYSTLPGTTASATGWTSPSAASALSVTSEDYRDWYMNYAAGSDSGNRGAYLFFDEGRAFATEGCYTVETDVRMTAGVLTQRSVSEFAILGTDVVYDSNNANNGLVSGYILKLHNEPPEGEQANLNDYTNQSTWYINDTEDTVTIAPNEWVHISAYVRYDESDGDKCVVDVTISDRASGEVLYEGRQDVNGSGELLGLYVLRGRGVGTVSVDNIGVSYSVGSYSKVNNKPNDKAWNYMKDSFSQSVAEDFTVRWKFFNYSQAAENYQNYSVTVRDNPENPYWCGWVQDTGKTTTTDWNLRADAYSNITLNDSSNADIAYTISWNWDNINFPQIMNGAEVDAALTRDGDTLTFTAQILGSDGETYTYTAVASGKASSVSKDLSVILGGENCYLLIEEYSVEDGICHYDEGVVTPPTCTESGYTTYTCIYCGSCYEDDVTDPTGHTWDTQNIKWNWADDHSSATATVTCSVCGETEELFAEAEIKSSTATCVEDGETTYTAAVTIDGIEYTDDLTVTGEALGHLYGEPQWSWTWDEASGTYTAATALFTCTRDKAYCDVDTEGHTFTAKDNDLDEKPDPATCESDGSTTYTATVTYDGMEYSDEQTVTIPATGHDWDMESLFFSWAEDYTSATATAVCRNDPDHTIDFPAVVTSKTTDPTCLANGSIVYTAEVTYEGETYTDTQTVVLPALGHAYSAPSFTWDLSTKVPAVTVTSACGRDDCDGDGPWTVTLTLTDTEGETEEEMGNGAEVTFAAETAADGSLMYQVTYSFAGITVTSSVTVSASEDEERILLVQTDAAKIEDVADAIGSFVSESYLDSEDYGLMFFCSLVQYYDEDSGCWITKADGEFPEEGITMMIPYFLTDASAYTYILTAYSASDGAVYTLTEGIDYVVTEEGFSVTLREPAVIACSFVCAHDYVSEVTVPATCTTDGEMRYICSICGASYTEVILAFGHSFGEPVFVWSENGSAASAVFTCSICGDTVTLLAEITEVKEDGTVIYTATVVFDGVTYTDTFTVLPAEILTTEDEEDTEGGNEETADEAKGSSDASAQQAAGAKTADAALFIWMLLLAAGVVLTAAAIKKKA